MKIVERRHRWLKICSTHDLGEPELLCSWVQLAGIGVRVMPPQNRRQDLVVSEESFGNFTADLTACVARRVARRPGIALAYSAFDVEGKAEWEHALASEGWGQLGCAFRYRLSGAVDIDYRAADRLNTTFQSIVAVPEDVLIQALQAIWIDSADPFSSIRSLRPSGYVRDLVGQKMEVSVGIRREVNVPVGLVVAGLARQAESEPLGWILDLGVAPHCRRTGIGGALLYEAVRVLRGLGAQHVYSVIDQENLPSKTLHQGLQFELLDGPYVTYALLPGETKLPVPFRTTVAVR